MERPCGYAVRGIGGSSLLLHRAQMAGDGSAAAAMLATAEGYSSASVSVSRQTTRADGGGSSALAGPASARVEVMGHLMAGSGCANKEYCSRPFSGPLTHSTVHAPRMLPIYMGPESVLLALPLPTI